MHFAESGVPSSCCSFIAQAGPLLLSFCPFPKVYPFGREGNCVELNSEGSLVVLDDSNVSCTTSSTNRLAVSLCDGVVLIFPSFDAIIGKEHSGGVPSFSHRCINASEFVEVTSESMTTVVLGVASCL